MKRLFISILLMTIVFASYGQDDKGFLMQYIVEGNDTIFIDDLPPAYKYEKPPRGKKGKKWRDYYKLVHNFARTYPYALIAKEKIMEVESNLKDNNLSGRKREKYISAFQDDLFATFEKPLKNMTYTQGRILLRLIDRETGLTPYYIIRNYRGRAAAGFWQGVAKLFGSDMKRPYERLGADKDIEELVQIYQRGEFNYLYASIFGKWPPEPVDRAKNDFYQKYGPANAPSKSTTESSATSASKASSKSSAK